MKAKLVGYLVIVSIAMGVAAGAITPFLPLLAGFYVTATVYLLYPIALTAPIFTGHTGQCSLLRYLMAGFISTLVFITVNNSSYAITTNYTYENDGETQAVQFLLNIFVIVAFNVFAIPSFLLKRLKRDN